MSRNSNPFTALPQRPTSISRSMICVCLVGLAATADLHADDSKARILEAWKKHTALIKSFQYETVLVSTKPAVQGETDLFGEPVDKNAHIENVALRSKHCFRKENEKYAYINAGQVWDEIDREIATSAFQACFDGRREITLLDGKRMAHGTIHLQRNLQVSQIRNVTLFAFSLWYSPIEKLELHGYQPANMELIAGRLQHNGTECIELKIPRGNEKWIGYLYVDPVRDYLPIRFVAKYQDGIMHECDISYTPHESVGWTVSKFFDNHFDESGKFDGSISAEVQSVSINEPIDDKLFTLEFPPGTQITEQDGESRKYYIQERNGKRREIPESEYGRLPDGDAA